MAKPNGRQRERTTSKTALADFAGCSTNTIREWEKLPGYPKAADGSVCKWDLAVWHSQRLLAADAPELSGTDGDSPGLERYRLARASQEEIRLQVMRGAFMDREWMHRALMEIASVFRGTGDLLQRDFGDGATAIFDDGLDEILGKIAELEMGAQESQ